MSASRRRPRSLFQPGMAAMWACTGASPVPFAICGLPPERRTGFAAFAGFPGVLPAIVLTPTEKALPRRGQERHEGAIARSEEHTSELQSLMRISYAVFCLKKKKTKSENTTNTIKK